ncbi:MAG: group II intron maturase-specific domain-containing protein, partial [Caulobacteraceae bacterium]
MTGSKIEMLAEVLSPIIRGWQNYFMKYNPSAIRFSLNCVNQRLVKWAMCKFKRFRNHRRKANEWLRELAKREPNRFPHWALGIIP